jgi:hypothetical protein
MTTEIKKTSKEWYELLYPNREIVIMDPDGWDRSNWDYSWEEEMITENEFKMRLMRSTIQGRLNNNPKI